MHRVDHLPIFFPDTENVDCPFTRVVIHWHIPVFQKNSQIRLLVQHVSKCLPGFPTFGHSAGILFHVRKESIHQWFYHQLTFFSPLILFPALFPEFRSQFLFAEVMVNTVDWKSGQVCFPFTGLLFLFWRLWLQAVRFRDIQVAGCFCLVKNTISPSTSIKRILPGSVIFSLDQPKRFF